MKTTFLRLYPLFLSVWYIPVLKCSAVADGKRDDRRFPTYKRQRRRVNRNRRNQSQILNQLINMPLSEVEEILGHPIAPNAQTQYAENAWGSSDSSTSYPSLFYTYAPTGKSGKGSKGSKSDQSNRGENSGKSVKGYSMPTLIGKGGKSSSPMILMPSPTPAPSSSGGLNPTYSPKIQLPSEIPSYIANIVDSSSAPSNLPSIAQEVTYLPSEPPSSLKVTEVPSIAPSEMPSKFPSRVPSDAPSARPSEVLSEAPSKVLRTNGPTVISESSTGEFLLYISNVLLLWTLL